MLCKKTLGKEKFSAGDFFRGEIIMMKEILSNEKIS